MTLPRRRFLALAALPTALLAGRATTTTTDRLARAQDPSVATPAPAASPSASGCPAGGACPVGCWEVADIGPFVESGLMGITGVRDLAYRSATGSLRFDFSLDGAVRIVADGYRIAVTAEIRFAGEVDTAVAFDGELTGRYALVGEELTIEGMTPKDLVITAATPVGDVGIANDDVFAGGVTRLVCAGDTLRLYPDPAKDAPIRLVRC